MKSFVCSLFLVTSFLLLNIDSAGAELKNADAFSFKGDPNRPFENAATVTAHKNAYEHAFVTINKISGINLKRGGSGSRIYARSTNSSSSWYGLWQGNANGGTIQINSRTTQRDNFTTSNYRKLALHELGHGMGMKHQLSPTVSVMRQGKMTYTDYTTLDKNNLRWRY
ncbi:Xaa-Pro aminopeptidase (plasmid) [Alkalihalophilus pseudofirmus OF4]|uniref:Xaa-Pro aminopeptidase n=2 Tax=Alkalihalophilus TaxID=2893060 RepID=D3G227_ALKPO|nr:Xaa-Pro aminopeptidase [Alkalihalophilus pseudofirmus]ADC52403.1 Xaa-Pro aminopeptidase [Alkalihalophilus pseudofirmus OF4]